MIIGRLPAFTRTTTFRLALVHTALFIFFAGALLFYLFSATAGRLERDDSDALYSEVTALTAAYASGGFSRLSQSVSERSSSRGAFLYLLVDAQGTKVAGDFDVLPAQPPQAGQIYVPFSYDARNYDGQVQRKQAEGRIIRFQDGTVLLVAYDIGARGEMVKRITDVVWTAAIAGLVLSLVGGVIVSRSVTRRVESLARTTEDVMAGDLSRRAVVNGSGDEFDRLAERLNAMLSKLERLMIASRYSGDAIAHDLRSPLARLRNHLETSLAQTGDRQDFEGAIAYSIEEVDRVLETFNAILRLSKVQGGQSGTFDRFSISDQCIELAEIYDAVCEEKNRTFTADIKSNLFVHADKSLITQVMFNLLDNAVKYTPEGGAVKLVLRRKRSGEIEFSVLDSGPGIPESDREKVFERFFRLEEARTEPGSGLGLSLVSAVAEMHQAKLSLTEGLPGYATPGLKVSLTLASA
ncbi:sensor histidine kinase [Hirschia litorea]|uniref:histidine kinase n=1 Tax=Hirschia litorea TaxID=1199156 RepID=A0ABW2IIT4_9PROT